MPTFNAKSSDGTLAQLRSITAVVGYEGGPNENVAVLGRYCSAPMQKSQDILDLMEPYMDGAIKNIVSVTHSTDATVEDAPETPPNAYVLRFRAWTAGQDPDVVPSMTLRQFLPFAVFDDGDEISLLGDAIAAELTADAAFELVEFLEGYVSSSRRR